MKAALDDAAVDQHDDLIVSRTVEQRCETMIVVRLFITSWQMVSKRASASVTDARKRRQFEHEIFGS